jgi:enoyl-CoA hydratase/carnithine racemase
MPEASIGFFPDVGTAYSFSRLSGHLGIYLGLTGHQLKAKEVYDSGLATHFLESSQLDQLLKRFSNVRKPEEVDELMHGLNTLPKGCAVANLDQINKTFGADSIEGILHNLKVDNTEWSKQQLKRLSRMSPTSLKVAHHHIRQASGYTLEQVLHVDYNLCKKFIRGNDFFEGVRVALVDKGTLPIWQPSALDQVRSDTIDAYFQVPNDGDQLV